MEEPRESAPPSGGSEAPPGDAGAPEAILVALARIFAIAPLYPAAHGLSQEVGGRFLASLRAAPAHAAALVLEVHRDCLRIAGQSVACAQPQVRRIHRDLLSLGIARVEIEAAATPAELHRFATAILEARRCVGAAHGFRQLELGALPESTRVVQREFGRRSVDAVREDRAREATDRVLEGSAAEQAGDSAPALRSAIQRMFGGVIETLAGSDPATAGGQPFARSLDAVLDLGVHALRHAIDELGASAADPASLRGIFAATEKALAISDDRASVEILLSVIARASSELPREEPAPGADRTPYELSVDALRRGLAGYGDGPSEMVSVAPGDRREELSILVHLLVGSSADTVRGAIEERLAKLFAAPLSPAERALLVTAIRDLAERGDPAALDAAVPPLTRMLRRAADRGLLGSIWRELARTASDRGADSLWPHLVNDLLLGVAGDRSLRRELLGAAARDGDAGRARRFERLARLEAVTSQRFAPEIFDPPPEELFPVFADLLAREGGRVAESVLRGLQRHPPEWQGAEALATFSTVTPACRALLYALLRERAIARASPALTQQAAHVLAGALSGLARGDAGADWVPRAIATIGSIGGPEDRRILREIRRGFRPWPWRRWPASCRRAARLALGQGAGPEGELPVSKETSGA